MSKDALKLAQQVAHDIWQSYDDTYGYASEKQALNDRPELLQHPDNMWFFWNQFDVVNQTKFVARIKKEVDSDTPGAYELGNWIVKAAEEQLAAMGFEL